MEVGVSPHDARSTLEGCMRGGRIGVEGWDEGGEEEKKDMRDGAMRRAAFSADVEFTYS
jgi:hypothetical protein